MPNQMHKYIWFIMIIIGQKDLNQNYLLHSIGGRTAIIVHYDAIVKQLF